LFPRPDGQDDSENLGHQHFDILLLAEYRAYRSGDLICRKQSSSDLIKHRPEEMIVVPVNDRHSGRHTGEAASRVQPSKSAADNNDMRILFRVSMSVLRAHGFLSPICCVFFEP
jgi:hypothetical protein